MPFIPPLGKQSDLCDFKARLATQQILGQPGLHRKTLSKTSKTKKKHPNMNRHAHQNLKVHFINQFSSAQALSCTCSKETKEQQTGGHSMALQTAQGTECK